MAASKKFKRPIVSLTQVITAAQVTGLGASTTGTITLNLEVPAKAHVLSATVRNNGTAAATLATLTAQLGDATDADQLIAAATVFAADAVAGGVPAAAFMSDPAADTTLALLLTGDANLSTMTGLTDGLIVEVNYIDKD